MTQDLDEGRVARLEILLGAPRLRGMLDVLRQRLERLAEKAAGLPDDADALQFLVHQSLGSARSLGLIGLAEVLDGLERGLDGEGIVEQVRVCRDRFEAGAKSIEGRLKS